MSTPCKLVGYGICGAGEADRYLTQTLDAFKICDEVIILGNNIGEAERSLIQKYRYILLEDNREWGKLQWKIKEDFVKNHVAKLNPDWTLVLDMDEVPDKDFTKESLDKLGKTGDSFYFYVVNLWDDGYFPPSCFQNIRLWSWKRKNEEGFYDFKRKPVHCGLAPAWTYFYGQQTPYILLHYGLKDRENRQRKVERYNKYDPNASYMKAEYYEWLRSGEAVPFDYDTVKKEVSEHYKKIKLSYKTPHFERDCKIVNVKRLSDGFVFPVKQKDLKHQLRKGFQLCS